MFNGVPQSRRRYIYWLCSSRQACPVWQHSLHFPLWVTKGIGVWLAEVCGLHRHFWTMLYARRCANCPCFPAIRALSSIVRWLLSYFANSCQRVCLNGRCSSYLYNNLDTLQRAVLSPFLCSLHSDSLINYFPINFSGLFNFFASVIIFQRCSLFTHL